MGADSVGICYGLRYPLGVDAELSDEMLLPLEQGKDPRMIAAKRVGLGSWFGRDTDGGQYFLYVGTFLGFSGVEGKQQLEVTDAALQETMRHTRELLTRAGLDGTPALHIQLEAQY